MAEVKLNVTASAMELRKWILTVIARVRWIPLVAQREDSWLQLDVNYIRLEDNFSSYVSLFPIANRDFNSIQAGSDGVQATLQYRTKDGFLTGLNFVSTKGNFTSNSYTYLQVMPTASYDFQLFSDVLEIVSVLSLGPEWYNQEGDLEEVFSFNPVQSGYSLLTRIRTIEQMFASLGYSFTHQPFAEMRKQVGLVGTNHRGHSLTVGLSLHLF
jgi:hypothetical protein